MVSAQAKGIIVGGGIGGLALALALHAKGIRVQVFESVPEIRALGVGINLLPHSTRVLIELGLREPLEQTAILTRELRYHCKRGKEIWVEPRGLDAGNPYPQYSLHRGHLQMILLEAVKRRLGPENVLVDHHLDGLETNDPQQVVARFKSKQTGEPRGAFEGEFLVGCDGIMSRVRQTFYPSEGPPKFAGLMLWRGIIEADPFLGGRSMVMAGHDNLKAVVYPISGEAERRGRSLINWVAERRVGLEYQRAQENWNRQGDKRDFVGHFQDWDFGWLNLPEILARTQDVYEFPMIDRDPIPRWTFDRVTLLGDAAHPMYPNGSNGASQAILDAEALAECLADRADPAQALEEYEERRRPLTSKLVLDNRQTGPERVLQMVEERCPGHCGSVHHCVPRDELAEVAARYKRLAGFDKESLLRAQAHHPDHLSSQP